MSSSSSMIRPFNLVYQVNTLRIGRTHRDNLMVEDISEVAKNNLKLVIFDVDFSSYLEQVDQLPVCW